MHTARHCSEPHRVGCVEQTQCHGANGFWVGSFAAGQGTTAVTARAPSPTGYTVDCAKACMVTDSQKEQHADEGCAEVLQAHPEKGMYTWISHFAAWKG